MEINMKPIVTIVLFSITACSANLSNQSLNPDYTIPSQIENNTKLLFNNMNAFNTKTSGNDIKSWFKYLLLKHHNIVINNISISGTNQRVDDGGNSEIKPNYSEGTDIILDINGKFDKDVVKSGNILFKNEANLIQLSYVGEVIPRTKILIDDSIVLEPISATKDLIKVKLNTSFISDFYLKGLHKFSIISDRDRTDTLIKVGESENPKTSLSPVIDEITLIRKKDIYFDSGSLGFAFKTQGLIDDLLELAKYKDTTPINIKIKGKNFPVFYKFSYSTIDSKFCFGHSTAISKNASGEIIYESIIHIPEPKEFEKKATHTLTYSTPFGTVIKGF